MAADDNARDRAHARRSLGTHKEDADYGLLKGAAAVIAGAAFLRYQPGGRTITRALGRTHQFVKNVSKTIDREVGKDITDMSLRDWRTVGNNLSSDWAKATRETDRVALDPNAGSLSHFVEGIETTLASNVTGKFGHRNISQTAYQTFMKDVVGKQMKDEVAAHLNLSRNDRIKFNAFISQVEKAPMSTLSNRQYMDRMQFTAEQQVHAENILKVMRARAEDAKSGKDLAAKDYMERIDHFLTKAKEDAYTLESLERNLGTLTKMDRDIGKIVGSRKATIGDVLDNAQAVQDHMIHKVDGSTQSMLQWMRDYESNLNAKEKIRFRNLLVDAENLRVTQQGELFSQKTGRGWYEDIRNFWAGTMPGQLFKLRELQTQDTVGSFQWFTKTMNNPVLKAKLEKMGDADNYHYRIGKDIYSMDEQGNTKLVIENAKMVSGRVGFFHGQLEAMSGLYKIKESDNAALRWFDLFQDREHYSGSNIANFLSRFGENRRQAELVDLLRNPNFEQSRALEDSVLDLAMHGDNAAKQSVDYVYQYGEILRKAERVLQTNTYQIDEHLLDQLSSQANQDSRIFFDLLKKDTRDIEEALLDPTQSFQLYQGSQFLNPRLRSLIDNLKRDPNKTRNTYELVTDPERLLISTSEESAVSGSLGNQTLYYEDILRKELGKEAILRQGLEGTSRQGKNLNYDNINALIDQIQGNPNSIKELRKLTQTAIFQHNTGIAGSVKKEPYELLQQIASARAILQGTSDSERSFQAAYDTIMKDEIGWLEASQIGDATPGIGSLDEFVYINRTTTPLDLISGLNEAILQKSMNPLYNRASSFANQFLAGRDNMEYVSEITMAPYFMLKRLSDELNTVGLGFSGDNLGSTVDLASAIMTKRVLPIGLGLTYFDWLDDTTREVTGQSLSGAFVNGIANVDLAGRRVISGLGLDEWIREEKNINPILQYWFEKDEYQGYEERKDYYERGYDPVRKSSWWTWGGVSEARGGEITYFTPSYARRVNSNYKDEAIYGGYFNKWYNTWIPTPVNPLAPLIQFFNPYSLEEQHEEDRPYAYSGPLFTEGTPWGALLNPTIGEILKPEKELHPYRLRNGVDAYALIDEINRSILQKARDFTSTNYMEFRGNSITAQWFNAWNAPIQGSRVLSYRSVGGSVAYVPSSVYGVYPENGDGTGGVPLLGSPNIYGFRSPSEGLNPAGGFHQDQSAGFNALSEMNGSAERLYALTQQGKSPGLRRLFDQWVFGDTNVLLQHGDIIMNEEGELGIYKDHKEKHPKGAKLTFRQYMKYQQVVDSEHSFFTKQALIDAADSFDVNKQLSAINARTKQLAREKVDSPWQVDEDEGFMSGQTLSNYRPSQAMDVLNDAEAVTDLLNASSGSDFIREATMSARLIGGIYGYMGSAAADIGVYNEKRPQRSDAMTAWNRTFWDYNMGGFGGITSEIMRRFIPPYSSSKYFSPLKNNMPEWLPDRFKMGSSYELIPEGEARLPGKGWEALNEYHSDMYSTEEDKTGAFDRYKILADIAPGSAEYKLWRDIAKKTVTDPELIAEMDEIRDRANRQSRKHDFYPYLIAGHDLQYQNVVVSEILGYGKFRSGSKIYKMAGISINGNEDESQTDVLNRYIHVGQTVTIATDVNASEGTNKDAQKSVNATVFLNGENINRAMLDAGDAKKRKGDTSASATLASLTTTQIAFGRMAEVIGHLDIPIISDQWLRVRSPIESYKAEYIYGTPYQSWAHPIDTFVKPAFERAIHEPNMAGNLLWFAFAHTDRWREHTPEIQVGNIHIDSKHIGRGPRGPLTVAALLMNREALIGAGIGLILKQDASFAMKAARASYNITNLTRFAVGGNSMLTQMISGALLGSWVSGTFLEQGRGKGAVIGAAAGAAWRFITGHAGDGPWVPERTKKNWESTDYFDRLQYLKYMGLYHEAARRAKEEEDVDVEELMERQQEDEEQRQKKLSGLKKLKKELNEAYGGKTSPLKKELLKLVNSRTQELQPESMYARGGEYTHSAILYKQAADRTMYGLRDGASWSEVMSALPTTDRDYFMEFIKEKDPQKRAEILATVSPFLQRALRMQWHMEQEERPTNKEFFEDHYLPDSDWEGWRPDVDIRDIQIKTIENQAQNLSDFGYYESQLRNPGVIMAEPLDMNRPTDAWSTRLAVRKILQGQGLRDVEVSVSERSTMSFAQIKAAIKTFISPKDQQRRVDDSISRQTGAA